MAGVALWEFLQVVLMVIFGSPKGSERFKRGYNRAFPGAFLVHPVDHLSRGLFLGLISVKDGGAVGSSDVIALPVDGCGIVHAEEKIQQVGDVGQLWVESDPESFRVPGMMLVGWVVVLPAGVAAFGIHHPRLAAKQFFHTPEASASYIHRFHLSSIRSYLAVY